MRREIVRFSGWMALGILAFAGRRLRMDRRGLRRLAPISLCLILLGAARMRGDTPPVIDCPWYSPTGPGDDFGLRAFYIPSWPGVTLRQVTLYLSFPAAGTYTLSLTANRDEFDGAALGTATASPRPTGTSFQAVTFDFGGALIPSGSTVTFVGAVVSMPSGVTGSVLMQTATSGSCQVIETVGRNAPLGTYRRSGIAVLITGDVPSSFPHTVTIPASASKHGLNGTFFHTDVWLYNSLANPVTVTATYQCYVGQSCPSSFPSFTVPAQSAMTFSDIVGTLFGAPETAGAIELDYYSSLSNGSLRVVTRTYSPSLPSPTTGAVFLGLAPGSETGNATFVGLGNNGGNLSAGFRTNAGVYNPYPFPTSVTFQLTATDGTPLGQAVTQSWGAFEARQINDIFGTAGAGGVVTTDAVLKVTSTLPVFPYVTVIDNVTGDSIIEWNP
jgi:hypothetical protein